MLLLVGVQVVNLALDDVGGVVVQVAKEDVSQEVLSAKFFDVLNLVLDLF